MEVLFRSFLLNLNLIFLFSFYVSYTFTSEEVFLKQKTSKFPPIVSFLYFFGSFFKSFINLNFHYQKQTAKLSLILQFFYYSKSPNALLIFPGQLF